MRLTTIGCSGSMSGPRSPASCYLVQAEGDDGAGSTRTWRVVLDLGSGAFGALLNHVAPADLDAVALSHLHADHVVDVTGLEVYRRFHPDGAMGPVRLLGPHGTRERVAQLTMADDPDELDESFTFETFTPPTPVAVGPLLIEPVEVNHPVLAYGLRITGPSSTGAGNVVLAYTGDTDTCDNLLHLGRDADLLLSEAAFQEGRDTIRGIHLTGRRAGQVAERARARRLVLTHLPPWNDSAAVRAEAAAVYSGPIDLAQPGATWQL